MEHPGRSTDLPRLLLLGTYHMANPNLDYANVRSYDVRSARRHAEIRECVERLKRFQPTRVAIEVRVEDTDATHRRYVAFRDGRYELGSSESEQIGFRVAAELNHDELSCIDWMGAAFGLDTVIESANENGQQDLVRQVLGRADHRVIRINALLANDSVVAALRAINEPDELRRDHQTYIMMAMIGSQTNPVGAEWVVRWYERNLRIFTALVRAASSPGERVLVIYGAGHIPLLSEFAWHSGRYVIEPVLQYLDNGR